MPYPVGIVDITKNDWIDLDECALFVEKVNLKYGKSYIDGRVRQEGHYNHSEKYTITLAISGDLAGERWLDF